jgi:hypothetical protein
MKTSIYVLAIALMTATPVFAQDADAKSDEAAVEQTEMGNIQMVQARTETQVIAALEQQGYEVLDTRRSLLGRIIITAKNGTHTREVVMRSLTGQILSDLIVDDVAAASAVAQNETRTENDSDGSGADVSVGVDSSVSIQSDDGDDRDNGGVSVSSGGGVSIGIGIGN